MKMRRSIIYGEVVKADFRSKVEIKIVGAAHPITSTAMIATAARRTRRKQTMSAGIGITIAPTVDAVTRKYMNKVREIEGKAGHGIDLDRARHNQLGNIIGAAVVHAAQPDPPRAQTQTGMGMMVLY